MTAPRQEANEPQAAARGHAPAGDTGVDRDPLRSLPPVHEITARLARLPQAASASPALRAEAARRAIEERRVELLAARGHGDAGAAAAGPESLADAITASAHIWLIARLRPALEPAINASGVFLHTGLGRAPLAPEAVRALAAAAGGFAPVEIDMETGGRGRRAALVEPPLMRLTGAEAATVVNNNAAALTIAIRLIASADERRDTVIVSRGELVEIGGAFRLPEIIEAAGARLREVGTTNRTRLADYDRAIDDTTCALLKVHPSNFRIEGFTQEASIGELAELGRARKLVTIHDIGSGVLNADMAAWLGGSGLGGSGARREPVAGESIAAGADLVLFSGDKLLGGPQCGVIVGGRELVAGIERHPLMRAVRVDKLTLSALEATLRLHEAGAESLPLRAMLADADRLRPRAEAVAGALNAGGLRAEVIETEARFGAGSAPGEAIASFAVAIDPAATGTPTPAADGAGGGGGSAESFAARLRGGAPRVLGRIESGRIILDLAAVFESQDADLTRAALAAAGASSG